MSEKQLELQVTRITAFIQSITHKTGIPRIVIGFSGGVDSTVALYLLARAVPTSSIYVLHMPYSFSCMHELKDISEKLGISHKNIVEQNIKKMVDQITDSCAAGHDRIRKGNIMARLRMIFLYDYAKMRQCLVCGTENKSEYHLGYFTRYGDEASDFEPIRHLYKTQIFELARYLGVPEFIYNKKPSADLWEGQSDEGEFGFTYEQADSILFQLYESHKKPEDISNIPKKQIDRVLTHISKNSFKHKVPYIID